MFESYILNKDDNLESIAKKFNTTIKVLEDLNNIYCSNSIREGMEIIVPENSKEYYNYYKVNKGDTLYQIARQYNVNPELLANMNGLNIDDYIYPNQELLIPKNGYSYYMTAEGDTLDEVIKVFNSNYDKFLKENKTVYLLAGQLLANKK